MTHDGEQGPDRGPHPTPFRRLARTHDAAAVRRWARSRGLQVAPTGALPRYVYDLYATSRAHGEDAPGPRT